MNFPVMHPLYIVRSCHVTDTQFDCSSLQTAHPQRHVHKQIQSTHQKVLPSTTPISQQRRAYSLARAELTHSLNPGVLRLYPTVPQSCHVTQLLSLHKNCAPLPMLCAALSFLLPTLRCRCRCRCCCRCRCRCPCAAHRANSMHTSQTIHSEPMCGTTSSTTIERSPNSSSSRLPVGFR